MDLKELKLTKHRMEALEMLGIQDIEALLSYYPFRYEIMRTTSFDTWREKDKVTFEAEIVSAIKSWRFGRNKMVCKFDVLTNDTVLHVTIFNRPWAKQLKLNQFVTIQGIYNGKNQVTALTYQAKKLSEIPYITPVYGLKAGIQQRTIRSCIQKALESNAEELHSIIPVSLIQKYKLSSRKDALEKIHFPETEEDILQASRTLKYEEFLRFFLSMLLLKKENSFLEQKKPRLFQTKDVYDFIETLPFTLTKDQQTSINDILGDMKSNRVMYRLVQGDVGCGKTLVAIVAMYAAVLARYQAALLAPTEILARQHYETICEILKDTNVRVELLYSGLAPQKQKEILERLEDGTIDILIGTHSIFQNRVHFKQLGLVVADEQQRFGVAQRRALREKGTQVDFLLMSATPIPRTLATTLYGDMDISTIETMPQGRKPVVTTLIQENSFRSVLGDIEDLLKQGKQLYVICAAVEESEGYEARDVDKTTKALSQLFKNRYRVGSLHGRMSSQEKQDVMNAFAKNQIQVLVATTVVEVGMNVVNATGMIVYDADRFGLSQLHQLRGRVQRGSSQGYVWLLSDTTDEKSLERLNALVKSSNGFDISYEDLRLRGPGDILGTRQSGLPDFILGNIVEDSNMIQYARKDAEEIFADSTNEEYRSLFEHIQKRNQKNMQFID